MKVYLARIDQVNKVVKAISAVTSDAVEIAKKYYSETASGYLRGHLHWIPILVKDVFLQYWDKWKGPEHYFTAKTHHFTSKQSHNPMMPIISGYHVSHVIFYLAYI